MMRAVLVGGLVVGGGCVSAQRTTYTQAFARTATNVQAFDLKYTAESILDGETLKVTVTSEEQCRTSATPIYRRTAHIERKPAQVGLPIFTPLYLAIYGVAGAGYGAVIYADTSADDQSTGIALMGVGGALLTTAAIWAIRARDTDEDAGEVEGEPSVKVEPCHKSAVANAPVVISAMNGGWSVAVTTDGQGITRVPLKELPEAALGAAKLGAANVDVAFSIKIGKIATSIPIATETASQLLATLVADPASRVARDREAAAKAACDSSTSEARRRDVKTKPDDAVEAWSLAKRKCAAYWSEDRDKELAEVVAAARDIHLADKSRDFDAALAASITKNAVSLDQLGRAEADLSALAALVPPDPLLDKKKTQLETTRRRVVEFLYARASRSVAKGELDPAEEALNAAGALAPNDPRRDRIARQIERRRDALEKQEEAKRKAEERRQALREGPVWQVEAICVGQGVIASASVRAKSKAKAFDKACAEFCSGYPRSILDDCQTSCSLGWVMTTSGKVQDPSVCSVHAGRE